MEAGTESYIMYRNCSSPFEYMVLYMKKTNFHLSSEFFIESGKSDVFYSVDYSQTRRKADVYDNGRSLFVFSTFCIKGVHFKVTHTNPMFCFVNTEALRRAGFVKVIKKKCL